MHVRGRQVPVLAYKEGTQLRPHSVYESNICNEFLEASNIHRHPAAASVHSCILVQGASPALKLCVCPIRTLRRRRSTRRCCRRTRRYGPSAASS